MVQDEEKIFITGGLGYVGGRCSKAFALSGYDVMIGSRRASLLPHPDWLVKGSIVPYSTDDSVEALVETLRRIDTVIHMASPNEVISGNSPETAILQNSIGTLRLCQAAKIANVRQLIFFSTVHVYGSPLRGFYDERCVTEPRHPYAYSHLTAEDIVRSFSGSNGISRCIVLRLSNSFGAPERLDVDRWTLLVNDLCRQAVTKGSLTLVSDGRGERDFITLEDVTIALKCILRSNNESPFEIYNLASGVSRSVFEMANIIAQEAKNILGRDVPIQIGSKNDAAGELNISPKKLINLGFEPKNQIRDAIREMLAMCRSMGSL
jgi:UDP-glucose 4-epimerase